MYTPAQVSEMLGIPPSTLRHYAQVFSAHLSDQVGRHHRLYSERDVLVFTQIKDLAKRNKPLDQIGPLLNVPDVPDLEDQRNTLALIPAIGSAIEKAETAANLALSRLSDLTAQLEDQKARIDELEKSLSTPWYKKIFVRRSRI